MLSVTLKNLYPDLTKAEKRIADFILTNPEKFQGVTSYELADITHVSQATIIRFSKKLGYASFSHLVKQIQSTETGFGQKDILPTESTKETNKKVVMQYIDILKLTLELGNEDAIEQTVDKLLDAKNRVAFGIGDSGALATYFANKLNKIGLYTLFNPDPFLQQNVIAGLGKDDVVVLISESGETVPTLKVAKLAKQTGAFIIAITQFVNTKLHLYSDLIIKTAGFSLSSNLVATTLRAAQFSVIDMIYLNLIKKDPKRFHRHMEQVNRLAQEIRPIGGF